MRDARWLGENTAVPGLATLLFLSATTAAEPLSIARYVQSERNVFNALTKGNNPLIASDLPRPVLVAGETFGTAVAVGDNLVAVASENNGFGRVFMFRRDGDNYIADGEFFAGADLFACATTVQLNIDNDRVFVSSPKETDAPPIGGCATMDGRAIILVAQKCPSGEWRIGAQLFPNSPDNTGFGAALGFSGNLIAVGSPADQDGAVRLYNLPDQLELNCAANEPTFDLSLDEDGILRPEPGAKGSASGRFGQALAFKSGILAVGAPGGIASSVAGSVSLYSQVGNALQELGPAITSPNTEQGDSFGRSIDISGDMLAIGSPGEDQQRGGVYAFNIGGASISPPIIVPPPPSALTATRFGFQVSFVNNLLFASAPGLQQVTSKGVATGGIVQVDLNPDDPTAAVADTSGEGLGTSMSGKITTLSAGAPDTDNGLGSARAFVDSELLLVTGFE